MYELYACEVWVQMPKRKLELIMCRKTFDSHLQFAIRANLKFLIST